MEGQLKLYVVFRLSGWLASLKLYLGGTLHLENIPVCFLPFRKSEQPFCKHSWPLHRQSQFHCIWNFIFVAQALLNFIASFQHFLLKIVHSSIPQNCVLARFSHRKLSSLELLDTNPWASGEFWVRSCVPGCLSSQSHLLGAAGQRVELLHSLQSSMHNESGVKSFRRAVPFRLYNWVWIFNCEVHRSPGEEAAVQKQFLVI